MKKILAFIILSIAMVSCYENYIYDFTYTSIYFPYTTDVRTVVVGEGMHFDVGAALGGVRKNDKDRNVSFILDNTLITPAQLVKMQTNAQAYIKSPTLLLKSLSLFPSANYTITNSGTMVIKTGQHEGGVTIRPDSLKFLNDSLSFIRDSTNIIQAPYVLPFRLTSADADSLMYSKKTNVVGVRFENMMFGNYWHGGAAKISKANQPNVDSATVVYRWAVNDIATKIWTLTTIGPYTLYTNGYYNQQTTKNELKIVFKGGSDVSVSTASATPKIPATAPTFTYVQDGACSYNQAKLLQNRKIFLKYRFVNGKFTYHCTDTIYFRNRIRDGINEWQDENPAHYTK